MTLIQNPTERNAKALLKILEAELLIAESVQTSLSTQLRHGSLSTHSLLSELREVHGVDEMWMLEAMADISGIPLARLDLEQTPRSLGDELGVAPGESQALAYAREGSSLLVAISNPLDSELLKWIEEKGHRAALATERMIREHPLVEATPQVLFIPTYGSKQDEKIASLIKAEIGEAALKVGIHYALEQHTPLEEALISSGACSEDGLYKALAGAVGVEYAPYGNAMIALVGGLPAALERAGLSLVSSNPPKVVSSDAVALLDLRHSQPDLALGLVAPRTLEAIRRKAAARRSTPMTLGLDLEFTAALLNLPPASQRSPAERSQALAAHYGKEYDLPNPAHADSRARSLANWSRNSLESVRLMPYALGPDADNIVMYTDDPSLSFEKYTRRSDTADIAEVRVTSPEHLTLLFSHAWTQVSTNTLVRSTITEASEAVEVDTDGLSDNGDAAVYLRGMLQSAIDSHASDIHFELHDQHYLVRMRINGDLQTVERQEMRGPKAHGFVMNKIKLISKIDLSERRQEGAGRYKFVGREGPVEIRVATMPMLGGEKAVLRILAGSDKVKPVSELDLTPHNALRLERLMLNNEGMLVICGPTGSGKTTTCMSMLLTLNDPRKNVITIESPPEIVLNGVNHSPVDLKAGYTFPRALVAAMRSDPDVIMVGEMRDMDTARTASDAANTGHLVISTLHSNSAPSAAARLEDLGVERYLVAGVLRGVVAQRLLPTLCPHCSVSQPLNDGHLDLILRQGTDEDMLRLALSERFAQGGEPLWNEQGPGCARCSHTGVSGRIAVHEILIVDEEMEECLASPNRRISEVRKLAEERGMRPMIADGLARMLQGTVSWAEVRKRIPTLVQST